MYVRVRLGDRLVQINFLLLTSNIDGVIEWKQVSDSSQLPDKSSSKTTMETILSIDIFLVLLQVNFRSKEKGQEINLYI